MPNHSWESQFSITLYSVMGKKRREYVFVVLVETCICVVPACGI